MPQHQQTGGAGKNGATANTNGKGSDANGNVLEIAKGIQEAQATAKQNRESIRRGMTPARNGASVNQRFKQGGLFGSSSPGSEPMTRFNRSGKGGLFGSSSPSSRSSPGSSYLSSRNSAMRGNRMGGPFGGPGAIGGPMTRAEQRRAAMMRGEDGGEMGEDGMGDGKNQGIFKRFFGLDLVGRVVYILKFLRIFVVAGALYLASKTFQARYVTAVFVNNEPPPNLMGFILTFVVIEAIFMALIMFIIMLLTKTLAMNEVFPITDEVFELFLFDSFVASAITAVLGLLLAMVVTKKKYFRYRTDGLRAIRSMQEMMLNVAIVTSLLPYFILDRARR